ncbi:hypothetical protein CDV36_002888 [Fusarium kuroshium]|uniref:Uncharacterized protein n=1 Tax=Fusarium kuroshium TaxID=2010991 RepID=A0A3M2SIR3_9HYPO|nr:hypothetical protein CDV36_002888 [Fusarium kuroshium]
MPKSYFPVPSRDCSPDGPIVLGSILADPLDPESPLNDKPISLDGQTIRKHDQLDVQLSTKESSQASAGLFAKIFHSAGLDVSGRGSTRVHSSAKFKKLQTLSFEPTHEYMTKSLSTPMVQQYLARYHMRKRVFMVTGVKIAFGAKVRDDESHLSGGNISLGLDADAAGLPLSVGPRADASRRTSQTISFKQSSPFVFAYRLREIRYRKGIPTKNKTYRDGALYELGGNKQEDAALQGDGPPQEEAIFLSIDDEDVTGDDLDLESISVSERETEGKVQEQDGEGDEEDEICELILRL